MVRKHEVSLAIPASLVSDIPHLREKTSRIGMVGRAAAIFGVGEIIIFPDMSEKDQNPESSLIAAILSYIETPQYLRKRLFEIRPELSYVGILPPLRTPHHPLRNCVQDLVDGEYREGAVVSHVKEGSLIDVGVEKNALIRNRRIPINTRITVKMKKSEKLLEAVAVSRNEIKEYWGYCVSPSEETLGKLLKRHTFDVVIATSKYGKPFNETSKELMARLEASHKTVIIFGAPTQGLYETLRRENLNLDQIADFVINAIPGQTVETVRTEEAIYVALGILNLMAAKA